MYTCFLCKKEIKNDVAHVNDNFIYHLSCYRKEMNSHHAHELYECPMCHTLGRFWYKDSWRTCVVCKGSGYITE